MNAASQRAWRIYAAGRRMLTRADRARDAQLLAGAVGDRSDLERWNERLARHHLRYRASVEPVQGRVAAVCVTSRLDRLDHLVASIRRQDHHDFEVVVVTNADSFAEVDVASAFMGVGRVRVIDCSPEHSLGACLNAGIDATDSRFVAKFDDDDHYGARYLSDALRAHAYAASGVVGKHSYYAHLAASDRTVLRFPGHEFEYTGTLAGGTLVIDRERTGDLRFRDVSLGEDRSLIADCHRRGISTFAADRFNFAQHRGGDNTWRVPEELFVRNTIEISNGLPLAEIDA
ncbi:MAG: glycosyltransferase family A protein [Actinomycetota bacterium]